MIEIKIKIEDVVMNKKLKQDVIGLIEKNSGSVYGRAIYREDKGEWVHLI